MIHNLAILKWLFVLLTFSLSGGGAPFGAGGYPAALTGAGAPTLSSPAASQLLHPAGIVEPATYQYRARYANAPGFPKGKDVEALITVRVGAAAAPGRVPAEWPSPLWLRMDEQYVGTGIQGTYFMDLKSLQSLYYRRTQRQNGQSRLLEEWKLQGSSLLIVGPDGEERHVALSSPAQLPERSANTDSNGKAAAGVRGGAKADVPAPTLLWDNALWFALQGFPFAAPPEKPLLVRVAMSDGSVVPMHIRLVGLEDLVVPAGRFRAYHLVVEPASVPGVVARFFQVSFWYDEDAPHHLLKTQFRSDVSVLVSRSRVNGAQP